MVITYSKGKDQPGKVANPARGQLNREKKISLSPYAPENLISRDGFSRTDGVHCRESAGTGPVVLEVVPVTSAAFSGITMDQIMYALYFPTPPIVSPSPNQEVIRAF